MSMRTNVDPEAARLLEEVGWSWSDWERAFVECHDPGRETTEQYRARRKEFVTYAELEEHDLVGHALGAARERGLRWLRERLPSSPSVDTTSFLDDMKRLTRETRARNEKRAAAAAHRRALLERISAQCAKFAASLREEIERDARGERDREGNVVGSVDLWLHDEKGDSLTFKEDGDDDVTLGDIRATRGFTELQARCEELGVKVHLCESPLDSESESHGVRMFNAYVTVGGWG